MTTENHNKQDVLAVYAEQIEKSMGSNPDTQGLGAVRSGSSVIGAVDAISGEGSIEVNGFVATPHELKQVVLYYMAERLELDWDYFCYGSTGSDIWRWGAYIRRRLDRIADIFGTEVMHALWEDATAVFRKSAKVTDEDWGVFRTGREEEQEAWRRENCVV